MSGAGETGIAQAEREVSVLGVVNRLREYVRRSDDESFVSASRAWRHLTARGNPFEARELSALCSGSLALSKAYFEVLSARLERDQRWSPGDGHTSIVGLLFKSDNLKHPGGLVELPFSTQQALAQGLAKEGEFDGSVEISAIGVVALADGLKQTPDHFLVAMQRSTDGRGVSMREFMDVPGCAVGLGYVFLLATLHIDSQVLDDDAFFDAVTRVHKAARSQSLTLPEVCGGPIPCWFALDATNVLAVAECFPFGLHLRKVVSQELRDCEQGHVSIHVWPSATTEDGLPGRAYEVVAQVQDGEIVLTRFSFGPSLLPARVIAAVAHLLELGGEAINIRLIHEAPNLED